MRVNVVAKTQMLADYRVDGAVMNVGGYNEYLSRLTRRISQALSPSQYSRVDRLAG